MKRTLLLFCIILVAAKAFGSVTYPNLFLNAQRIQELQTLVAEPGSVHAEIYAAIKARVDTGDWQTYTATDDGNWNYHRASLAREASLVYLISKNPTYAQLAFEQLWDVHNDPDPDNRVPEDGYGLARAYMTLGFAQVYNWAYDGLSAEQRSYLLNKLNLALDAWVGFSHPNLSQSDRASNWVAVCRSAELIAILATGQENNRASRLNILKNDLNLHLANGYGALAMSQEGSAYTGYAAHFLYAAVYALQQAGDNSLNFNWSRMNRAWAQMYLESFSGDERSKEFLSTTENRRLDFSVDGNHGDFTAKGWASLTFNGLRPEDLGVYRFWYDRALGIEN
ncbi:MAG: hypothetical protein LR015_05430, partial [Verrucomicrobia bacterium]|nr:hypothetical protein [Verrucomicrobiota bacterium]